MTVTRTWYLEINSVPLATWAWEIPDLSTILDDPALRGSDRIIPGTTSVIVNPRRIAPTVITFPLDVVGHVDEDNTPYEDVFEGLITNMDYLKANLGLADPTGTVPAIYHRGDLDSMIAEVHFLGFKGSKTQGDGLIRTTFDISIPLGVFESTGS